MGSEGNSFEKATEAEKEKMRQDDKVATRKVELQYARVGFKQARFGCKFWCVTPRSLGKYVLHVFICILILRYAFSVISFSLRSVDSFLMARQWPA